MRLAARLRKQIADGTLEQGMPTPSITSLCQELGHARQTCAKALRILEDEGLLTRYPGLGYFVGRNLSWHQWRGFAPSPLLDPDDQDLPRRSPEEQP